MSLFERRTVLFGLSALIAGCGFRPVYGDKGASAFVGSVRLQEAIDPESYAFRERMRRRVGHAADGAEYALAYRLEMLEEPVAINPASDVTRYQLEATANWRLVNLSDGAVESEGSVKTKGGYDATSAPFSTQAAQRSEREQLATELAELTSARLLALMSDG